MKAWLQSWGITLLIVLFFLAFGAGYFLGSWEQSFKAPAQKPAQQYCYRINNMDNGITTSVTERCVPITQSAAR